MPAASVGFNPVTTQEPLKDLGKGNDRICIMKKINICKS